MVRALLIQHNTPDPGCKLLPTEVLFPHPLRDTLPLIRKDVDTFHNNQFANYWREAWRLKEQSLKTWYVKSLENLAEHSCLLPPFTIGSSVFIQNQTGQFPTLSDRSGTVVNVKGHDQYVVKVTGTGRLTLRNRRFLRSFKPHLLFGSKAARSLTCQPQRTTYPWNTFSPLQIACRRTPLLAAATPTQRLLRQQMYNHTLQHQWLIFWKVFRCQIWIPIYHLTHQRQQLVLQEVFRCQIWAQTPRNSQHCYADLVSCNNPQKSMNLKQENSSLKCDMAQAVS